MQWSSMPGMADFELILDAIIHKNPNGRILEVGAGAGAATDTLMNIFAPEDMPPRFGVFDYTDVDDGFLDAAKERYRHYGTKMRFNKLDIEAAPEGQGFEVGTYDVVIAAAVSLLRLSLVPRPVHVLSLTLSIPSNA